MKPCRNCGKEIIENRSGPIISESNPDGTHHLCYQIRIDVTFPGEEPFGITMRVKREELLRSQNEVNEQYAIPVFQQIRQHLLARDQVANQA